MAVTFNVAASATALFASSITVTPINVVAGSNIAARVAIEYRDDLLGADPGAFVSAITLSGFSGTPTFVQMVTNLQTIEVWQVVGGTAGAQTCVVTFDAPLGTPSVMVVAGVQVMSNVRQAGPVGVMATAVGFGDAIAVTLTGTAAGSMCCNGAALNTIIAATATVGGGAIQDWNLNVGSAVNGRHRGLGSHIASAGGNVTMTWALSATRDWSSAAEEWLEQPASAAQGVIRSPGLVASPL